MNFMSSATHSDFSGQISQIPLIEDRAQLVLRELSNIFPLVIYDVLYDHKGVMLLMLQRRPYRRGARSPPFLRFLACSYSYKTESLKYDCRRDCLLLFPNAE